MANTDSTTVTRLRGLLEVTRLMRDEQDVDRLLDAIARTIAQSLGYRTVVVNLYRPAWNHFEVTTVHGRPEAQAELLGDTLAWEAWAPLLDDRYRRGGAYLIAHGTFDWSDDVGRRYIPDIEPTDDPDAWHPDDELFVPLAHSDGHMLGILSVGEPVSGVRPGAAELEVLVAVAEHAALALQAAQENASSQAHRAALAELLQVSSRLTETLSADAVLQAICRGISGALGFQKVLLELPDPVTGVFESRASHGWQPEQLAENSPVSLWELAPLLDPPFEIEGCYLVPEHEALARLPAGHTAFRSQMNGSGPWAWDHHYLAVPLHDREGLVIGLIWSDDPADRLLPTRPMLQALRVFANQAAAALDSAGRFQEMRFLAEHDPLTRLLNRRAFTSRVQAEIARSQRHTHEFALVLCDLDGFKQINDREGHLAGDDILNHAAAILGGAVRTEDTAFRVGGDEFALILPETTAEEALPVVERLSAALAGAADRPLSASFGVAVFPSDGGGHDALFRAADAAMYTAKRDGSGIRFAA